MAPPPPLERSRRFELRISDEERDMLRTLAEDAGLSEADIVRLLIREAYRNRKR